MMAPALYVVATPLGNLEDITLRALQVLAAVDCVAAEDTRHTTGLLRHHGIGTRLLAVHEHNEAAAAGQVIARLAQGQAVALVSDAGTPGISDPGARLVAAVQAAGHRVIPIPGPSAVAAALCASGLAAERFHFCGFLPPRPQARRAAIEQLRALPCTLVFYEAPHRIAECVDDLAAGLEPEREVVICRELTKLFEQIRRMPLARAPAWLAADPDHRRGEFVLVVSAPPPADDLSAEALRTLELLRAELPLASAVRLAAAITGAPRKRLYEAALAAARDVESTAGPET